MHFCCTPEGCLGGNHDCTDTAEYNDNKMRSIGSRAEGGSRVPVGFNPNIEALQVIDLQLAVKSCRSNHVDDDDG